MLPWRDLCQQRRVRKLDLLTPMLIPSFSSKGFSKIEDVLSVAKDHITDVAMLSSYDIFYNTLGDEWVNPSLLFIDSGGYEARPEYDISEVQTVQYHPKEWTRAFHRQVLSELCVSSALGFVSFDEVSNGVPISQQIDLANALFGKFPEVVSDFLVKPYLGTHIDMDDVIRFSGALGDFNILGFTEKELGLSLVERLCNTVRIRQALMKKGFEVPIHIFGCLDPLSVQLFYLCGADIFDGLSWLRYGFHDSAAIYRNNWAAFVGCFELSDTEILQFSWLENLGALERLRTHMIEYATCLDVGVLDVDREIAERVLTIVEQTMDEEGG